MLQKVVEGDEGLAEREAAIDPDSDEVVRCGTSEAQLLWEDLRHAQGYFGLDTSDLPFFGVLPASRSPVWSPAAPLQLGFLRATDLNVSLGFRV